MLGSFYEKTWDLNRQTQQDPHSFTTPLSIGEHQHKESKRKQFSVRYKMHLTNDEHVVRFSGVPEEHTEVKVQDNGIVKTEEKETDTKDISKPDSGVPATNEVSIPLPDGLVTDAVLDTVLTAWTLLVQRYQRDLFHQFTWGIQDAGSDKIQCLPTPELDLLSHKAAGSLKARVADVRLKDVNIDKATIFLNDGTQEEV